MATISSMSVTAIGAIESKQMLQKPQIGHMHTKDRHRQKHLACKAQPQNFPTYTYAAATPHAALYTQTHTAENQPSRTSCNRHPSTQSHMPANPPADIRLGCTTNSSIAYTPPAHAKMDRYRQQPVQGSGIRSIPARVQHCRSRLPHEIASWQQLASTVRVIQAVNHLPPAG